MAGQWCVFTCLHVVCVLHCGLVLYLHVLLQMMISVSTCNTNQSYITLLQSDDALRVVAVYSALYFLLISVQSIRNQRIYAKLGSEVQFIVFTIFLGT